MEYNETGLKFELPREFFEDVAGNTEEAIREAVVAIFRAELEKVNVNGNN